MSEAQLVKAEKLSYGALDALDREVEDFGVEQALLPLRPFTIEGEITYLDWEEYQGQAPKGMSESEGLKFLIKVKNAEEPTFINGKGVTVPAVLKAGLEYPNIYFAKHPKLTFALPDHAKFRARLFAAISPGSKPSAVLQQLRRQTLAIPMRMTRTYVRTTRNGADILEDSFELLSK